MIISIIGFIAAASVLAFNNARMKARDAKRLADIKQIQTALELYYDDNNNYPNFLAYVGTTGMGQFVDIAWSTNLQPALKPYLFPLPKEPTKENRYYLYNATNGGKKYGLAISIESPSNFNLVNNDGGWHNNNTYYYEVGPSPAECALVGKDWWTSTPINCP